MSRILDVYMQDNLVGYLESKDTGQMTFIYDINYLNKAAYGISISLPLQEEIFTGLEVNAFFSGLLPEESVRERLAKFLGISNKNSFALLEEVGGDCAGALSLYPHGFNPLDSLKSKSENIETLNNLKIKEILNLIKKRPMLAGDNGYRLSLAGAQDKLAIRFFDNKIILVKNGYPTTHILKPIIEHIKDSAYNELFCMKLARSLGINVPEVFLYFIDNTPYYIVERYDRFVDNNGNVKRIHQEDFCQALGIIPERKYEREGGPSIKSCQELILNNTMFPAVDNIKLLNIIIFNYLIGNADAHGKNFSLLYNKNKPELSPFYDLLSTAVYSELSENMAMKLGGKYKPKEVCLRHFYKLVASTKLAESAMNKQIKYMTNNIIECAVNLKINLEKNGINSDIFNEIINLIKNRVKRISRML